MSGRRLRDKKRNGSVTRCTMYCLFVECMLLWIVLQDVILSIRIMRTLFLCNLLCSLLLHLLHISVSSPFRFFGFIIASLLRFPAASLVVWFLSYFSFSLFLAFISFSPFCSLCSLSTLCTLCAICTLHSLGALRILSTLCSLCTLCTLCTLDPLFYTMKPSSVLCTLDPYLYIYKLCNCSLYSVLCPLHTLLDTCMALHLSFQLSALQIISPLYRAALRRPRMCLSQPVASRDDSQFLSLPRSHRSTSMSWLCRMAWMLAISIK